MKTRRAFSELFSSLLSVSFLFVPGAALVSSISACGTDNVFDPLSERSDKEKASKAIQDGDYDSAIRDLEAYLKDHPDDANARSMLANAYLAKTKFNVIQFGTKVTSGSGDWKGIVGAMPAGSAENVASLTSAVNALKAIPASARTPDQTYNLALAQATLAVTLAKQATDGNEKMTDAKVDAMSDAQAEAIYDSLKDSKTTVAESGALKDNQAATKLGDLAGKIAAQPGATDAEKMKAFLKSNNN